MDVDGGALSFKSVMDNDQLDAAINETLRRIQGLSDGTVAGGKEMETAFQKSAEFIKSKIAEIDTAADVHINEIQKLEAEYKQLGIAAGGAFSKEVGSSGYQTERQQEIQGEITMRKALLKELQDGAAKFEEYAKKQEETRQKTEENANSQVSMRTRIRALREEMMLLIDQGIDEQSEAYKRLESELGRLTDIQLDVQKQGRMLANDEAQFQGIITGLSGLAGGFSAVTGAVSLFAGENEDLQKVMTKLQSVMAITMGMQQVAQTLNKDSAFQLVTLNGLKEWWRKIVIKATAAETAETVATAANTAAKNTNTTATGKSATSEIIDTAAKNANTVAATAGTAANLTLAGAFRAVGFAIKSIPVFGWIIAGISALVGLVVALTSESRKAAKEIKEFNAAIVENSYKSIGSVQHLSAQWTALGNNLDAQNKFIENNKKAFDELGISIRDVADAENLFVKNKDNFIVAQIAKAKAAAVLANSEKLVQQAIEADLELREAEKIPKVTRYVSAGHFGGAYSYEIDNPAIQKALDKRTEAIENMKLAFTESDKYMSDYRSLLNANSIEIIQESEKLIEQVQKQSIDLAKLRAQLADDAAQAEIDRMAEGTDKIIAQNELDFQRKKAQIEEQYAEEDSIRAKYLVDTARIETDRANKAALDANAKAEADAQQDALDGFRSFEQEYLRLYEEFQTKRAEAIKAGADNEGLVLADFNFNESIKQLAADFAENTPEFKDFANTIKQIVDGVTEDSAEAVLQNAITQLEDMLATAKAEANALMDGGIVTGEGEKYKIALAEIVKLEEELESLRSKGGVKKTNDDWKKTYSTLQKIGQEFEEIGSAIGGTIGEMISLAGTIATNTVQAIDSIRTIATAAKGTLSALDKASMILTAIAAIGGIIGSIISGNAQKKREAAQAREAENIRRQEGLWESINYQIERQIELLDSAAGSDYYQVAADALNQYNDALELAIKNIPKVITDADKLAVLISEGKITGKAKEIYMDSLGVSNEDIENAKTWYPLVINGNKKSLTALKENEEVWALIPTHIQDAIEKIIEYEDSIEDFKQRIKDDLLGTSDNIAKTLGDSLMEAFENGTNAAEAWGKAVDEIIRDIAVNALLYKTLEKQVNKVIDEVTTDWFDADGNLRTYIDYKKELSDFEKGLDALGPAAEALGKSIKDVFGTGTDAANASRTSAAQGLAQASQDSIDGLTGIITNIENHTYTIAEILKAGTPGFSTGNTSNIWANLEVPVINIADMMKQNQATMQANMSALLADTSAIRSNTNRLEAVENHLFAVNRRLTDINDGITQLNRR